MREYDWFLSIEAPPYDPALHQTQWHENTYCWSNLKAGNIYIDVP